MTTTLALPAAQPSLDIAPSDNPVILVSSDDGRQTLPFSGAIATPARLVRAPLSDLRGGYDADAWSCSHSHTFFVAVDSGPIACPTCEHVHPIPSRTCTGCGDIHPRLADDPITFICAACREDGDIPPLSTDRCCLCDTPLAYPGAPCGECTSGECIYCQTTGHVMTSCPKVAVERAHQEQLSRVGKGAWAQYTDNKVQFLSGYRNANESDRLAIAEGLSFYLNETHPTNNVNSVFFLTVADALDFLNMMAAE